MNISLTSTLSAFKPPADTGPARPGTAPKGAAAALLETGLQAQLINKDTTIPQAVKDEKLKALSPKAAQALALAQAETEAASKSDLVDSTDGATDPVTGDVTGSDPAAADASADDSSPDGATTPATYDGAIGKAPQEAPDQAKGVLVDVQA